MTTNWYMLVLVDMFVTWLVVQLFLDFLCFQPFVLLLPMSKVLFVINNIRQHTVKQMYP